MSKPTSSGISVQTSPNLIFFKLILNLCKKEYEQYHELGEKILKEFEYVKEIDAFKKFQDIYEAKKIPQHPWQYMFYSIHTNEDLSPKSESVNDMYGPKKYELYYKQIYPLFREIFLESNFEKIYEEKISDEYNDVVREIQTVLDKEKPEKELFDFWGNEDQVELFFIPDFLRMNGGGGASRKDRYYTFTGCVYDGDGEIVFKPSHYISNLLHEYSHSFFKGYTFASKEVFRENMKLCEEAFEVIKSSVDEDLLKTYSSSINYFEETYIRAVQVFLNGRFLGRKVNEETIKEKTEEKLESLKEMGFLCVYDFYEALEKGEGKDPGDIYFGVMREFDNKEYKGDIQLI